MDCKTALTVLEAYLDNELGRVEARELEAHVDACADCRAALTRLGDLRQSLRDQALRHAAPVELRERIRLAAAGDSSGSPTPMPLRTARRALPEWTRLAAACVLAFGAGGLSVHLWNSGQDGASAQKQLAHDLFASHWRALAATAPVDVVSSDRHTVKPWFAGKVAESPLVRDFAEQGFALLGGRLDYLGDERVAVLVYRHGRHIIDVFVVPRGVSAAALEAAEQQGYALTPVELGSQPAVIVSDMDREERSRFAQLVGSPM
jgi:anti-sigma factor (TIGR02949 family)